MTAKTALYRLDSSKSTLLVSTDYVVPRILWFGERLPDAGSTDSVLSMIDIPVPQAKLDQPCPLTIFPDGGSGYSGQTALRGHRAGADFVNVFNLEAIEQTGSGLVCSLLDGIAQLRVRIQYLLEPESNLLQINTSVENLADTDFTLDHLCSATLPLNDTDTECLTLYGRWGLEFQQQRHPISHSQIRISNISGRTSHEHAPACIVGATGFSYEAGDVLGAHLAYSGNYEFTVERLSSGEAYMQAGMAMLPGEVLLAAGERLDAPSLLVCRAGNLNDMSQRFHHYARKFILPEWTRTERPVHANSWEALYFNHDESSLLGLVDAAAAAGAERFVLDDGWFHGRRDDTTALGDWWVDEAVYPQGLHGLVKHVRKHGMQFGLWFEPEMVSPDSDLYRAHPSWALHVAGHETPLARNQLVLNLGLEEVRDYLYNCIASLVREYSIDYIKWDLNRDLVLPGCAGKAGVHKQILGVYELFDRLTDAFPQLEIESCSSGGARADYGILSRTGRVWTSDSIDAIDRLSIQRGFGLFFPPEIMGAHVGHDVAHLTGRAASLQTRAIVAMQGQFGYEFDARELSDSEQHELKLYADCYKRNRHYLGNATSWVVDTRDTALYVQGQVSVDRQHALWTIVADKSLTTVVPERVRLTGLDADKHYKVNVIGAEPFRQYCKKMPQWLESKIIVKGSALMSLGLSLPIMPAQSALLLECAENYAV